jgi:UDP-N-acetylmuramoyl-tripeptide--D-alanyl-D-alanine ligase
MVQGTLGALATLLQAEIQGEFTAQAFSGISTDTRQLSPGSVFVALQGETFDGHTFAAQAMEQGAVAVVASQPVQAPHLLVSDTLEAYQQIGRWWRSQFAIPLIAITGSAGKTSTKEMLAAALARYGSVLKSQANHNNDIGVTQTLLQIRSEHAFVVLEMAMRGPGEIARLARTAQPTHAIITNIGSAHIGRLGSRQAIAQAKCELLAELGAGIAILNGEDDLLLQTAQQVWSGSTLTYGLDRGAVRGQWDAQASSIAVNGVSLPLPLPGRHQALNWMAVLATIQSLELSFDPLHSPLPLPADLEGRNQCLTLPGDVQILDETYNAAPEAMMAALHLLKQTPARQHWAILGPMRELGSFASDLYAKVGAVAANLELDHVLVLDPDVEMQPLLQALAPSVGQHFSSSTDLLQTLLDQVQPGDRLLFKAARAIQLEQLMQQFIAGWRPEKPSGD